MDASNDAQTNDGGQQSQPPQILPPAQPVQEVVRRVPAQENANVALSGESKHAVSEGPLNIGMEDAIQMPDEPQQRAGFFVPETSVEALIQQFPEYKRFVPKGE